MKQEIELAEQIFGSKYKYVNGNKQMWSRRDMWEKLIKFKEELIDKDVEIAMLKGQLEVKKWDLDMADTTKNTLRGRINVLELHNQIIWELLFEKCREIKEEKNELLDEVKEMFETVLDKAIKNCSINERYYDQIFEKLDELKERQ